MCRLTEILVRREAVVDIVIGSFLSTVLGILNPGTRSGYRGKSNGDSSELVRPVQNQRFVIIAGVG